MAERSLMAAISKIIGARQLANGLAPRVFMAPPSLVGLKPPTQQGVTLLVGTWAPARLRSLAGVSPELLGTWSKWGLLSSLLLILLVDGLSTQAHQALLVRVD